MYYLFLTPLIFLAIRTLINIYSSTLLDFSMYLTATNYFLAGHNPYLAIAPQVYPPAFLYIMTPLTLLPVELARTLWTTLSLASFFYALYLLLPKLSLKIKILIFLITLQLFPVKYALTQGQINFFVFLGFVILFHLAIAKKNLLAGVTLAVITIMKLNPILLLCYFLILKKYRLIAYCFVTLILLNLTIDFLSAHNLTLSFFQGTLFRNINPPLYYYNQSLPALLYRLNLASVSNYTGAIFLFFTGIFFFKNPTHTQKYFSLFLITILLISPITWQHYLFWSLPAFIYLLQNSTSRSLLVGISFILININLKNPTPFDHWQAIYSHATLGLLLLYFLVLKSNPKGIKKSPDKIGGIESKLLNTGRPRQKYRQPN